MKYAYIIVKNENLVSIGYADFISELSNIIGAYTNAETSYNGMGCYGHIFQRGSYTMIYWNSRQNGFVDVRDVMNKAFEMLNSGGMIHSHNEVTH